MPRKPYPSEIADRFIVRMPEGLRDRIAAAAKANSRSMNSEIVATLEEAYPPEPTIEDVLAYARMLANNFVEAPNYADLRALREAMKDVVEQLQHGAEHGYPEPEIETLKRHWIAEGRIAPEDVDK
jgi:hypothetical protein